MAANLILMIHVLIMEDPTFGKIVEMLLGEKYVDHLNNCVPFLSYNKKY